jgi:hypothetical protein
MRKILYFLIGLYVLFALMLIFNILNRAFFLELFNLENMEGVYKGLFLVGIVLLAFQVISEQIYNSSLNSRLAKAEKQITDLKAKLYDKHHDTPVTAGPPRSLAETLTRPVDTRPEIRPNPTSIPRQQPGVQATDEKPDPYDA